MKIWYNIQVIIYPLGKKRRVEKLWQYSFHFKCILVLIFILSLEVKLPCNNCEFTSFCLSVSLFFYLTTFSFHVFITSSYFISFLKKNLFYNYDRLVGWLDTIYTRTVLTKLQNTKIFLLVVKMQRDCYYVFFIF